MTNVFTKDKDSESSLRRGIKRGYFKVNDSGSLSLDLPEFLKSAEGKERFIEIINSMPKVKRKT